VSYVGRELGDEVEVVEQPNETLSDQPCRSISISFLPSFKYVFKQFNRFADWPVCEAGGVTKVTQVGNVMSRFYIGLTSRDQ
jgi:hypothetical protein